MFHVFLLERVLLSLEPLVQPVRVLDPWHRIHALLQSCWDSYDFHNCASQSLLVVIPVKEFAKVKILETWVVSPLAEELLAHSLVLVVEDLNWDGSHCNS